MVLWFPCLSLALPRCSGGLNRLILLILTLQESFILKRTGSCFFVFCLFDKKCRRLANTAPCQLLCQARRMRHLTFLPVWPERRFPRVNHILPLSCPEPSTASGHVCRQAPPSAHKTGRAWPPQLLLSPRPVSPLSPLPATHQTPRGSWNCPSTRPLHWFFPGLCPAHPLTFLGLYKCLFRETLPPSNITGLSHSVVSLLL